MKTLAVLLAVLGLAGPAAAAIPTPSAPGRPLRVVSYNVLHGGVIPGLWGDGLRLDDRLQLAAERLRALDVDVVGLQEASTGRGRGNVAERLASLLGFEHTFAPATSRVLGGGRLGGTIAWLLGFEAGDAILSRYPIRSSQMWPLPSCGSWTPRVLLCAELDTPWGPLDACSTHVAGNTCQARSVAARLRARRRRGVPLVLAGDLNAPEDSAPMRLLLEEGDFVDTFRLANPAAPGFTTWQWVYAAAPMAWRRVDYVLFAPGATTAGRVIASRVVLDAPGRARDGSLLWPSDHYGVLSEIALTPTEPPS